MSFLVYVLIGLMPGDPIDMMIAGSPHMAPEDAARLRSLYGLDKPLIERYFSWLLEALNGDFGYSRLYSLPVGAVLLPMLGHTALLMGLSLLLTIIIAVPLGVYAAYFSGRVFDRAANLLCFAGISVPPFWLGLLMISLFAVTLGWLPASATPDQPISLLLPVATLTATGFAVYTRHMRASMLQNLNGDHIRTARAKGCTENLVLWRHAFKGALAPLVTLLMLDMGTLFGGALTIETVFAFPGMGKLMFDALMGNDYNLALMGFLLLTACVLFFNLLADVLYALIDPRASVWRPA